MVNREYIERARLEKGKGYSQETIAHSIGITYSAYQKILNGTEPKVYTALKLCKILDIDIYIAFQIDWHFTLDIIILDS